MSRLQQWVDGSIELPAGEGLDADGEDLRAGDRVLVGPSRIRATVTAVHPDNRLVLRAVGGSTGFATGQEVRRAGRPRAGSKGA